jgi:hypothetical protein
MEGRIRRRTRYATRPLLLSKRQVRQSTRYATKLNFLYKERVRRICDMQQDLKKRVPSALGECCHIPFCNVSMQWKHSQQIAGTLLPRVVWMLSNTPTIMGKNLLLHTDSCTYPNIPDFLNKYIIEPTYKRLSRTSNLTRMIVAFLYTSLYSSGRSTQLLEL